MGKVAFLFAGQGAQKPGMGLDLYENSGAARSVYELANRTLGFKVSELCFGGPQEELDQTINTQPCVLATDIAAARALISKGITPDGCAGFSLGEIAALSCAGVFSNEQAFALVAKRAAYMQEACEQTQGGMAAVIGAPVPEIEDACDQIGRVWAVNYNCPGQTVVAGAKESLAAFIAQAKERKWRALPLPVSGAFHTELMEQASQRLLGDLTGMAWSYCYSVPVYGNTLARPYPTDAKDDARALLAGQLMRPVRWEQTIRRMVQDGFDTFIECGPGGTLTGFFKRMKLDVRALCVQDAPSLQAAIEAMEG